MPPSDPFASFDWNRLTESFARRETEWMRFELDERRIAHDAVDDSLETDNGPDEWVFRTAWMDALDRGMGAATLLSVYAYTSCQRTWELGTRYDDIRTMVKSAHCAWEAVAGQVHPSERLAVRLMLEHSDSLWWCMMCENAVNCSCPDALGKASERVAHSCQRILKQTPGLHPDWNGFRGFLEGVLKAHLVTFGALPLTALAIRGWIVDDEATERYVVDALKGLDSAEKHPDVRRDVYASELRAHRHTLEIVKRRLDDPRQPTVRVDEAKLIYCYPFAWRPGSVESSQDRPERPNSGEPTQNPEGPPDVLCAVKAALEAAPKYRAVGIPETLITLSEIWNPSLYKASVLSRPTLTVRTTAEMDLDGHRVEVRFGALGNHHVRIERTLTDASLHDVNQGLRRGSPQMGSEGVTDADGGSQWTSVPEYAKELVARLLALLGGSGERNDDPDADVRAQFHVILEIRSASIKCRDGEFVYASKEDLVKAAGGLLLQPVQPLAASLEEWTRLAVPDPEPTLRAGFATDLVARTANTTVLFMPGTPNWVFIGYEEIAEFTASLRPLLLRWKRQLTERKDTARKELAFLKPMIEKSLTSSDTAEDRPILTDREHMGKLEVLRIELQTKVSEVRHDLGILKSTALCQPASNRIFLDDLYTAAGLTRLEKELDDLITEVEAFYAQVSSFVAAFEERRKQRYELNVQLILAALAVASLAGVGTLVNSSFVPTAQLPLVGGAEITALILLTVFVVAYIRGFLRVPRSLLRRLLHLRQSKVNIAR
jgi:hypothetical protein